MGYLNERFKIALVKRRINKAMPSIAYGFGSDITAMVANRVIKEGKGADGSQLTQYSTNKVPAFFYFKRSRAAYAERKVRKAASKGKLLSYKEFRRINRLQVAHKDYSFTGAMWENYGVLRHKARKGGKFYVVIGVTKEHEMKIAGAFSQQGKNILMPSQQEIDIATQSVIRKIERIIEKSL